MSSPACRSAYLQRVPYHLRSPDLLEQWWSSNAVLFFYQACSSRFNQSRWQRWARHDTTLLYTAFHLNQSDVPPLSRMQPEVWSHRSLIHLGSLTILLHYDPSFSLITLSKAFLKSPKFTYMGACHSMRCARMFLCVDNICSIVPPSLSKASLFLTHLLIHSLLDSVDQNSAEDLPCHW